ncbi:MAG: TonB-dependent receptor [Candidatus Symbiothrix sp.]|jgi:TonB-linked SusC/RagA family outer membrane protein|nr:TonB-dependent receptor [Candidatus Symbiothrix sp.]
MKNTLFSLLCMGCFLLGSHPVSAQNPVKVTGTVMDETGETLIGVSITIKGTTVGVVTDSDGRYTLSANTGAVLEFSYIGYQRQSVKVSGPVLNVTLAVDSQVLEDVVVVGYGVQKKASVVGAISTVSTKDLTKMSTPTLSTAITGQLPGVITIQPSSIPGVDETEIYIRGKGTWGDSNPLIIVDGIERATFTNIDPHEVETISVLKDASATAVYGVKGANGVVLITTRRGTNSKPQVSFSATMSGIHPTRMPKYINSYETAKLKNEALMNDGLPRQFTEADLQHFIDQDDPYHYPDVDWIGLMVNDFAIDQQYNLNVAGGTSHVRYFVSAGYLKQDGMFKTENDMGYNANFGFQRFNFRSNVDANVTSDLTLSLNLAARIEDRRGPGQEPDALPGQMRTTFSALTSIAPYDTPVKQADGTPAFGEKGGNPWTSINRTGYQMQMQDVLESVIIIHYDLNKLLKGLSVKGQVSYDSNFGSEKRFRLGGSDGVLRKRLISPYGTPDEYLVQGEDQPLQYDDSYNYGRMNTNNKIYFDASVFYKNSFGNNNISLLGLYNQSNYDPGYGIPYRYQGLVGRLTYDWNSRYFTEFNVGYNGSENFAKGKRFGVFPSFSLGWLLSEEPFIKNNLEGIQTLKIRGSYGIVGNDKIGSSRFLYKSDYIQGGQWWEDYYPNFGTGAAMVQSNIREGRLPNLNVTWEKAEKSNVGLEFSAWKGLVSFTGDYFYEKRNNILMERRSVSAILGADPPPANVGKTTNQGFELEIGHRKKLTNNFSYWIKANISQARNKILNYDEPAGALSWQKQAGQSIDQFWGLITDGFFNSQEEIDNYVDKNGNKITYDFGEPLPGDYRYIDYNGDGRVNEYDRVAIGHTRIPEYNYAVSAGFDYKGFDFNMLWQGVSKVSMSLSGSLVREFLQNGRIQEHHFNRWAYYTDPDTGEWIDTRATATYPRLTSTGASPSWQTSTASLYNGAYMKLRHVEVGYTVPAALSKRWYMGALRFFVSGNNLLLFSDVKQVDPEGPGYNDNREQGYNYPQTASYNFGVNITF